LSERERPSEELVVFGVRIVVCAVEAEVDVGIDPREVILPFPGACPCACWTLE
jgi:hypothetical protein